MSEYQFLSNVPSVSEYCRLRLAAGLTKKSEEAAQIALRNTWYGVRILLDGDLVGMGRIIGDGGCFFQVVDIAVLPEHQGKGLGKRIMTALMEYFEANAPATALISLFADGEAKKLYAKFGFEPSAPASIGMWRKKSE